MYERSLEKLSRQILYKTERWPVYCFDGQADRVHWFDIKVSKQIEETLFHGALDCTRAPDCSVPLTVFVCLVLSVCPFLKRKQPGISHSDLVELQFVYLACV